MASSNLASDPQSKHTAENLTNKTSVFKPLGSTASYASKAFAYSRVTLGAASVLTPHLACGLFKLPISDQTATVVRLFGVRGVALGGLLFTAGDNSLPDGGRRELRRVLWANVACDMTDFCSLVFALAHGHIDQLPGTLLMGGAAMLVGIGTLGLKNL